MQRRIDEQARCAQAHRVAVVALAREWGLTLASHDDTTDAHVAEAHGEGCTISEFPTTREAAIAARGVGMAIVMGAPNVILGGSHWGKVAADTLAVVDLLDGLSSDYVTVSLTHAAFRLDVRLGLPLERAVALVGDGPAAMLGFDERGALVGGRRADLVRVRRAGEVPTVLGAWREGRRVA